MLAPVDEAVLAESDATVLPWSEIDFGGPKLGDGYRFASTWRDDAAMPRRTAANTVSSACSSLSSK